MNQFTSGAGVTSRTDAHVLVVGAGPSGATAAYHLAAAGLDVLVLEKSVFPREKVCGDGLTPRAVRELDLMGVPHSAEGTGGWVRNKGLRVIGGGHRVELPWPELDTYPSYGLVRTRQDFDEVLADHARAAGARIRFATAVTGPVLDERTGRIVGVTAKGEDGEPLTFRAPLVVAADGVSGRLALGLGIEKRDDRPIGVALRTYFRSPRTDDAWLETWLELPGADGRLLPGYGWVFGLGDGTSNVGLGVLDAGAKGDLRAVLERWVASMPPEWEFTSENRTVPVRGAALPMGFSRTPHYKAGLLLVGDAGGMVNPFNGEGIAYAMESARLAADVVVRSVGAREDGARERVLETYPEVMRAEHGGYYTLGRGFVDLIGHPRVYAAAMRHGLPHATAMRFALKLFANLTDPQGGDAMDRVINGLNRVVKAA